MRTRLIRSWQWLPRPLRIAVVSVVGSTLLLFGALMLVLPGPGLVVLAAGLAVFAAEFAWARKLLIRAQSHHQALIARARRSGPRDTTAGTTDPGDGISGTDDSARGSTDRTDTV